MMVIFVSQCEKKALRRTRRILDAFADRIGDSTWQTVITREGLDAVNKLLKQTASKSTAVSCHWIRSRSRSDLLWVVGNKEKFNNQGVVAVNSTEKDLLNSQYESDWKYLPVIKALVALAGLFHDWGKASDLFQNKLKGKVNIKGDPIRHEWVSCLLFNAFIHTSTDADSDKSWLQKLIDGHIDEKQIIAVAKKKNTQPLSGLSNSASLICWLIVSHHRMPLIKDVQSSSYRKIKSKYKAESLHSLLKYVTQQWGYENRLNEQEYQQRLSQCLEFSEGLLSDNEPWLKQVQYWANFLTNNLTLLEASVLDGSWRSILLHARLCLMLGDHFYSSQPKNSLWKTQCKLYANTRKDDGVSYLNQQLDEHLLGVTEVALDVVRLLPHFESKPLKTSNVDCLKPRKNTESRFRWQDKAAQKIRDWRKNKEYSDRGFFVVNMASTGCGKTMANAKVMKELSDDGNSLRYILALGLRTLTLQTGDEYRNRIGLEDADLGVMIGSKAVMELHDGGAIKDEQDSPFDEQGAESREVLSDQEANWQGVLPEEELTTVLTSEKDRKLLHAPVLVCTIDHIMSATETKRGGRYILPWLRLMSSDLVIDEIDDFTGDDLIAIGRLIHLAGMLGRKVMISSATIPPDLAEGYFNAYQEGRRIFAASREVDRQIDCCWIDEFNSNIETVYFNQDIAQKYQLFHNQFIDKRSKKLKKEPAKRKANIYPINLDCDEEDRQHQYFDHIKQAIMSNHDQHHITENQFNIAVSFGVVRMANISPCIELAKYLMTTDWPDDVEIRCMPYHSQQILLLRHEQEQHLDAVLKRKEMPGQPPEALSDKVIQGHLRSCKKNNLIFILVATPVEEVGRDHDFDWAVVEPSSYRSIIQLAGRVRRHRSGEVGQPNVTLLQYNWKAYRGNNERVFERPGYETADCQLNSHNLADLLDEKSLLTSVSSIARIKKPATVREHDNLADLEHFQIAKLLTNYQQYQADSLQGYLTHQWWMTAFPQKTKPFRRSSPTITLYQVIDKGKAIFVERDQAGNLIPVEKLLRLQRVSLPEGIKDRLWLDRDYFKSISNKCNDDMNEYQASLRYGELSFTNWNDFDEYEYNDHLGLVRIS
jgi:CRISPR-associated endonuclease/helicase Cas3